MSDLLPPNATIQERALSETTARISNIPTLQHTMYNPETCPASVLPWLAWALSVDDWDTSWTEDQQRWIIASSLTIHKHKGTIGAVKSAMEGLGFSVQIQEWFNQIPAGDEYTYKILIGVDQVGFDLASLNKVRLVVETTKNLRSHMTKIEPIIKSAADLYAACAASIGNEITVKYEPTFLIINEHALVVPEA